MCAIAGCIGKSLSPKEAESMLSTMLRRGPDGQGCFRQEDCTLLHTRLAIIDPAGGQQPMTWKTPQESYTLVYNGELYNTRELRLELEALGHEFHGHSDTEVVLHACAQWGHSALDKMNGIFAFAFWMHNAKHLLLARDRIGVKPLFYCVQERSVLFASEIKTILASPWIDARLDREGAAQLLLFGPGRLPGSGIFHNILELEPGCYADFQDGHLEVRRYWMLRDRVHVDSFPETVETVRALVIDSILRQTVSDVPIGTFLSGGLDSSIISAVVAGKRDTPLDTFSVGYLNESLYFRPGKFQPSSDRAYIDCMNAFLNSRGHKWELTPEELIAVLEDATCARDLPGMADVDFSLLLLCRNIRSHVKVALSGECADEIFGGYPWYRDPQVRQADGFPWAQNTEDRCRLPADAITMQLNPREYIMDAYRKTCRESHILPDNSPQERRIKEMVNLNFRWFMQTLLDRKDRMSMYCGLEVRVPFCDYRIAEYLYAVPWEFKEHGAEEKGLLRAATEDLLPPEVAHRKKSPYPKTFDPQYEALLQKRMQVLLNQPDAPLFSLVRKDALESILDKSSPWPWYGQLMRRPQKLAYFLQMDYWLRHYHVQLLF